MSAMFVGLSFHGLNLNTADGLVELHDFQVYCSSGPVNARVCQSVPGTKVFAMTELSSQYDIGQCTVDIDSYELLLDEHTKEFCTSAMQYVAPFTATSQSISQESSEFRLRIG